MSVCLITIAGKEEYADIRQVSACSGCPYSVAGVPEAHLTRAIPMCGYYKKSITLGDAEYAMEHDGKPAWCTLDYVIVVHKQKGD